MMILHTSSTDTSNVSLRNIVMSVRGDSSRNDVASTRMDISNDIASPMMNNNCTPIREDTSGI